MPMQVWDGDQKMSRDNIGSAENLRFMPMSYGIVLSSQVSKKDYEEALLKANSKSSTDTTF